MSVGDKLLNTLVTLENGSKTKGIVDFKIQSKDLRRTLEQMGKKTDNMSSEFEALGDAIQQVFIQHWEADQGPDRQGDMVDWPPYSDRAQNGDNWIQKKMKDPDNVGGDKLLYYTGALVNSMHKGAPGNIHVVTNKRLEIGTDIPYAMFHEEGWEGKNGPTEDQTRRPIWSLTDSEMDDVLDNVFEEEFFKDL